MRHAFLPAVAMLAGLAAPALAAPGFATGDVNLRAGPGTSYPRVVTVPRGAAVEILGCLQGYSWCDVGFNGVRGWVSANYLQSLLEERRVPLAPVAPQIGLPVVTFQFGDYWRDNYRGRPWYADRDRWGGPPPPPRAAWREGPPPGRGPDWRNGPQPGRGPDWRGPDGRGPDGRGPDGRGPDGRGPDGRGADGRGPDRRGPDARGPDGRGPGWRDGPPGRPAEWRGDRPDGRRDEGRGRPEEGRDGRGPGMGGPDRGGDRGPDRGPERGGPGGRDGGERGDGRGRPE